MATPLACHKLLHYLLPLITTYWGLAHLPVRVRVNEINICPLMKTQNHEERVCFITIKPTTKGNTWKVETNVLVSSALRIKKKPRRDL